MSIQLPGQARTEIYAHLEAAYPDEGAGFLFGRVDGDRRLVEAVLPVPNAREDDARRNRYLITPQDMLRAELQAEELGMDILGVFHSHPDVPNVPSAFDRDWALPWYSYAIARVDRGTAVSLRSWRLADDRSGFVEEEVN